MDLESLREQLHQIDEELLALVAKRQRISTEIGRVKRETGGPPRDFRQEREVIERARDAAGKLGLSRSFAEKLLLLLIESSLTIQEQGHVAAGGAGGGKRVLVIGGAGKMGRWFVRFLDSQGFHVDVADPSGEVPGHKHFTDWHDATLDHDFVRRRFRTGRGPRAAVG